MARDDSGSLVVFVRGTNDAVWLKWQLTPGSSGSWSGWYTLGGVIKAAPVVATNADGRLEVFGVGSDNALWQRRQAQAGPSSGGWYIWRSLSGVIVGYPAVGKNADGRLEVFVWWTDGSIRHNWQLTPGNTGRVEPPGQAWSDWHTL